MHSVGGRLTADGARALSNSDLKLVRTIGFPPRVVKPSGAPDEGPVGRSVPFVLDEKTRELVDLEASPGALHLLNSKPNKHPYKIVQDKQLPSINPDVCDRDATHHMVIPAPLIFRWDLNLESSSAAADAAAGSAAPPTAAATETPAPAAAAAGGAAEAAAEAAAGAAAAGGGWGEVWPSLVLNVDSDVGIGAKDRDSKPPQPGQTDEIPVHRADVVWAFKGTGQPKVCIHTPDSSAIKHMHMYLCTYIMYIYYIYMHVCMCIFLYSYINRYIR